MNVLSSWTIGLVTSRFNSRITENLEIGALKVLDQQGVAPEKIRKVRVPGAVEIPLAAKWLLESGCDGVITVGAVIRGETSHYDYVCNSVERGCRQLMLETGCPIAFGVLTKENAAQAEARAGGAKGNKGAEAAEVLLEMLSLKMELKKG